VTLFIFNQVTGFYMTTDNRSTPVNDDIWKNELLTIKEVATFLRLGRVTVWRWCKEGTIPACQIGHHWRIPRDDLLRHIEAAQIGYATHPNSLPPAPETESESPPLPENNLSPPLPLEECRVTAGNT
jgi:excisionase family DNA binding protein